MNKSKLTKYRLTPMKQGPKIFITFISIIIIGIAGFIFLYPKSPLYLLTEECPPIEFPMEGDALNLTDFNGFNISNWGEPGVYHNGIDFPINPNNWTGILAVADGTVTKIEESGNTYAGGKIMFNVYVTIARGWTVKYVIEPMATTEHENQLQRDNIYVIKGQEITKGDRIARLLCTGEEYSHLHFMLEMKNTVVCPYLYSSPAAKAIYEYLSTTYNKTICCTCPDADGCTQ
ncbi:MAG: M23 family metallopeptidase [Candidatus Lokiarchaeota archaeon]|nr:M23 family metallopeptidase [Candidatus Lokiarchaeota archaeon]